MIARLVSFFTGWKAKLLALSAILAALGAVLARVYLLGKAATQQAAERTAIKAMRRRKEVDDEVSAMDHSDLDEHFSKYMRDRE
ncbi:conserved hypothetical protein [Roseibium sp. TrichSKD4]|uniref:hypothetical protein n=1 Tax=Roseibium sp. TrichSKD4 TaxID=744980 RepID=UPI0001E575A6|nr:hypothetical protein [Roseibium sp. TrichSKD4]EFO30913.1 conserved hypothetical protein [Roseibium sp. TrichSKD4]